MMADLLLKLLFVVFSLQLAVESVLVLAGDPFVFPVHCKADESATLMRVLGQDGILSVAVYKQGQWSQSTRYRDRITGDSSRIVFNPTYYTDRGVYELICGGDSSGPVQLDVVPVQKVSVPEGDQVILSCFYRTDEKLDSSFHWERNGTVVCELNSGSGVCSGTADVSVSPHWSSHGDMSLTVKNAQLKNQGDYLCLVNNQLVGSAVRLTVTQRNQHTITQTPGQQTQINSRVQIETWKIVLISISVTLLGSPIFILIGWCLHARCRRRADGPSAHELESLHTLVHGRTSSTG